MNKSDKLLGRPVPPTTSRVTNNYEKKLSQGQSKNQNLQRRGTVPPNIIEGVEQKSSKPAMLLGRAVPPTTSTVINIYEQNLTKRGNVPPSTQERADQSKNKHDCLQSRTVPPKTPREKQRKEQIVWGGTVPVKQSQTQKILQNLAKPESHGSGTVLTSAKSKSKYFQAVENLEHLETSKNSKNGFKNGKTSSKISSKIESMKKL